MSTMNKSHLSINLSLEDKTVVKIVIFDASEERLSAILGHTGPVPPPEDPFFISSDMKVSLIKYFDSKFKIV